MDPWDPIRYLRIAGGSTYTRGRSGLDGKEQDERSERVVIAVFAKIQNLGKVVTMKLVFKKAFDILLVPPNAAYWMLSLGTRNYKFQLDKTDIEIGCGWFGRTPKETRAIKEFLPPHRIPPEHQIPTFDVAFEITTQDANGLLMSANEYGAADSIVEPHIAIAFRAARVFIETYRDSKYLEFRDNDHWKQNQILLPPRLTEHEFRTLLFYVLTHELGETFVGAFSEGESSISNHMGYSATLQEALQHQIPKQRKFLLIAWERFFFEDFDGAVIYAAVSVERVMARILRMELTTRAAGTDSQIGKVLEDTSNRLLCTVMLGTLGIGDSVLRERLVKLFEVRNALAHGYKLNTRRSEAEEAIEAAESFVRVVDSAST